MLNLLADENFKAEIFDGLRRRDVEFDLVLPTGAGLLAAPDPRVLEWAAARNRILLTHDRKTMLSAAHAGIAAGLTMPGLIFVP